MADLDKTTLAEDMSFLLARASAISVSAANAALAPLGLRARSYSVLTVVADGARPTQRDLADFLRLDPSQVVAIVDDLEGRGLVQRVPDPADRRAKIVVCTSDGAALQSRAAQYARAAERATHALLSEQERPGVIALLRELAFPSPMSRESGDANSATMHVER
ncbi:MarR family transcriptional regulator [Leifsonia sp. Leaf336]|uniref:MarR family winged helix-turn-helix transcriptional regulator n=1 Tax=Leifsonia sp. Leaf336 TaxID=1736341 RepID=UPI000700EE73|nr:MarR family transcriptional regulator [Leifsonia sp. Leaf336]KQR53616.1 MarR family transcriptional regulator [Leifsonia sp. Leaf336]